MNILSYFENDEKYLSQVDPEYRGFLRGCWTQLKKHSIPGHATESFMAKAVRSCEQREVGPESDPAAFTLPFITSFTEKLSAFQRLILRFADLPLILFLYAGIYEVGLDCLVEPLLNGQGMQMQFPFTISLLANTLIIYAMAQVLMLLLMRASSTLSLYYWAMILVGFLCFLGLMSLSRTFLSITLFEMHTFVFIIAAGFLAWGALHLYRRLDRVR